MLGLEFLLEHKENYLENLKANGDKAQKKSFKNSFVQNHPRTPCGIVDTNIIGTPRPPPKSSFSSTPLQSQSPEDTNVHTSYEDDRTKTDFKDSEVIRDLIQFEESLIEENELSETNGSLEESTQSELSTSFHISSALSPNTTQIDSINQLDDFKCNVVLFDQEFDVNESDTPVKQKLINVIQTNDNLRSELEETRAKFDRMTLETGQHLRDITAHHEAKIKEINNKLINESEDKLQYVDQYNKILVMSKEVYVQLQSKTECMKYYEQVIEQMKANADEVEYYKQEAETLRSTNVQLLNQQATFRVELERLEKVTEKQQEELENEKKRFLSTFQSFNPPLLEPVDLDREKIIAQLLQENIELDIFIRNERSFNLQLREEEEAKWKDTNTRLLDFELQVDSLTAEKNELERIVQEFENREKNQEENHQQQLEEYTNQIQDLHNQIEENIDKMHQSDYYCNESKSLYDALQVDFMKSQNNIEELQKENHDIRLNLDQSVNDYNISQNLIHLKTTENNDIKIKLEEISTQEQKSHDHILELEKKLEDSFNFLNEQKKLSEEYSQKIQSLQDNLLLFNEIQSHLQISEEQSNHQLVQISNLKQEIENVSTNYKEEIENVTKKLEEEKRIMEEKIFQNEEEKNLIINQHILQNSELLYKNSKLEQERSEAIKESEELKTKIIDVECNFHKETTRFKAELKQTDSQAQKIASEASSKLSSMDAEIRAYSLRYNQLQSQKEEQKKKFEAEKATNNTTNESMKKEIATLSLTISELKEENLKLNQKAEEEKTLHQQRSEEDRQFLEKKIEYERKKCTVLISKFNDVLRLHKDSLPQALKADLSKISF